jgi:DNA-dependent metalloprotease WSS1
MALAEHEWNPEFAGRNFNAGELIELVLRGKSGQWLPFKHVQLVMMHELAHCKQMNHSPDFWKVRNQYCEEVKGLWNREYTGEGLWGRGRAIDGRFVESQTVVEGDLPEHVCSGTYRRQRKGRKRKRGDEKKDRPNITYAERQQKRILKKFGTGGTKLGDDEDTRIKLEEGKKQKSKPRVAGSARGRDLRAAAALARFETVKKEEVIKEEETDSDTESDYDWPHTDDDTAATDRSGKKIIDSEGHGMVRVCEAEDENDEDVKREMEELRLTDIPQVTSVSKRQAKKPALNLTQNGSTTESDSDVEKPMTKPVPPLQDPQPDASPCPTCSFSNAPNELLCIICSNVLRPNIIRNTWKCQSQTCRGSAFINHGDSGRCAVCGSVRA